jgi:hypothetical protein
MHQWLGSTSDLPLLAMSTCRAFGTSDQRMHSFSRMISISGSVSNIVS